MSGESDVIKEFLVSLGFKIDEGSFKKFSGGLEGITKDVFKLGLVITGALAATDIFVSRIAEGMDKLYFSSKRTGSTIQEMNSFQFAIKQLGGSSEEALSAMEALASFRLQYGKAADAQLVGFGVKPEDVDNSKKSLDDLSVAWQKMAKEQGTTVNAFAQAQALHIPENTFRAMLNPNFQAEEAKRDEQNKRIGVDQDAIAEKNREFVEQLDQTANAWHLVGLELENSLIPLVKIFKEWSENLASLLPGTIHDAVHGTSIRKLTPEEIKKNSADNADAWDTLLHPSKWTNPISIRRIGNTESEGSKQSSMAFWMSKGYTREQAAGWVANEQRESSGNPNAEKIDEKTGENSRGLFQWSLERRAAILKNFGIDINTADRNTQLQAAYLEAQRMGLEKKIKGISGGGDSAALISRRFERPGNGDFEAQIRAADAIKLLSAPAQDKATGGAANKDVSFNQTNHMTINAPSSHAKDIGTATGSAIGNQAKNLVNTMKSAVG